MKLKSTRDIDIRLIFLKNILTNELKNICKSDNDKIAYFLVFFILMLKYNNLKKIGDKKRKC